MEDIKSWAMIFCSVSVLLGILQMVLPEKEQSTGIKLVMGLYIVVTILQPAVSLDWNALLSDQQPVVAAAADTTALVEQKAGQQLAQQLQQKLEQAQLSVKVEQAAVTYSPQDATAELEYLVLSGNQRQQAQAVVEEMFGTSITVQWLE